MRKYTCNKKERLHEPLELLLRRNCICLEIERNKPLAGGYIPRAKIKKNAGGWRAGD